MESESGQNMMQPDDVGEKFASLQTVINLQS